MSRTTALDHARSNLEETADITVGSGLERPGPAPVVEALPEKARKLVKRPDAPSRNPVMECPNGHRGHADTMVDVKAEGLEGAFPDSAYVCTSCIRHARRSERLHT